MVILSAFNGKMGPELIHQLRFAPYLHMKPAGFVSGGSNLANRVELNLSGSYLGKESVDGLTQ